MADPTSVVVDVYRDGFLVRRETLAEVPAIHVIGSSPSARLWLDSNRVDAEHAILHVAADGRVIVEPIGRGVVMGRRQMGREELFRGAPIGIRPYVLVLAKRPRDPEPGPPPRLFPPSRERPRPVPPPLPKPEPGPAERTCPRCATPLVSQALPVSGPAYRTAPAAALVCPYCSVTFLAATDLAARMPLRGRLADTPALRSRANARGLCPVCRDDLAALQLAWADAWVTVEECRGCGLVALDPREIDVVSAIVRGLDR